MFIFTRIIRYLILVSFGFLPMVVGCICIPPDFIEKECVSNEDCYQFGSKYVCKNGACMYISDDQSCTTGETRVCTREDKNLPSHCRTGIQKCVNGRWATCQTNPAAIRTEVCNGIDDNCNGQIDETFPEKHKFCTVPNQHGPCSRGEYQCYNGKLVCVSSYVPVPEGDQYGNCDNGIDDNCNGYIDDPIHDDCGECKNGERRACYPYGKGMQDPTLNRGQCKAGQQLCSRGRWGLCEGAVTPQLEICGNGIDENCDGFDEDCPSECSPPGQKQDCYSGPPETRDIGECRAGTRICGANGKWGPCEGEVTPQPEICFDGKDNDCNSKIDDGCASECKEGETKPCYSGPPETKDVGACKAGTQTCEHGKWGKCSGEILPKREICGNNIDDDCNGKIDDCEPTQLLSGSWDTLSPLLSWDLKTAQVTQYYQQGHTDAVSAVAYSPDGKSILSAGHDKQLIAWDANTAKILWQRTEHTDAIYSIAVDPNGQFVATGSGDQTIRLWNPSDGKVKHTLPNNTGGVYSMAIAPSGKLLAAGCGDGVLRIWDLSQSPKIAHSLTGHGLSIFAVAVNRNGTLIASGSRDGSIRLWQTNGSPGPQIADLSVSITALTFANQNPWLAIATSDGEIQLWDLSSASPQKLHTLTDKDSGQAYTLLFHPLDSNLVSGHYNNGILFWDTKTNKLIQSLHGHKAPISSLAFRP